MKMVLFIVGLLCSFSANAEWSKDYSVNYIMGDGDNRMSARQAALEQVKMKASNEAGTYIQGTTTLHDDGNLTESILMLSASMVKVLSSEEKLAVNSNGQAVLQLKARASLDESELVRRIEMLRQDKAKELKLKQLQSENEALRNDYLEIRKLIQTRPDQSKVAELLAKQDATLDRISMNSRNMTSVFEPGELLQIARQNTDDFEKAKRFLDDNFYAPLLKTPITAVIQSVEAEGNGYVAWVRVGWSVDQSRARQALARFLKISEHHDDGYRHREDGNYLHITIGNLDGKGPTEFSERLFWYIAQKEVNLKLSIAGQAVLLPVLFNDHSAFNDCGTRINYRSAFDTNRVNICLLSHDSKDPKIVGVMNVNNPVRIPLTKTQAEMATHVVASIEFKPTDRSKISIKY